ncbi:MAG: nickel-dependent hydrogenase large subunit [Desulfovibrio sp.]|uniref:nickel-dependent hydrogenase large subunit n=1 Tax=Desulfovibrio sp. 7SRBS1 TaxID=3378064 RepID=UPI003B40CAE3
MQREQRTRMVCVENTFVISARLSHGQIAEAWSTGKMVRSMNFLLGTKLEGSAPQLANKATGICNDGHSLAAVRAIENLVGVRPPEVARLVRNLAQGLRLISGHLMHFYHFSLSHWLNLGRALRADPAKAVRLADCTGPRPAGGRGDFYREALERLGAQAEGEGGEFFAVGDWDHPAFAGEPEVHLLVFSHCLEALKIRSELEQALKLLRCTGPAHPSYRIGGLSENGDGPDLSSQARTACADIVQRCREFIRQTFLSDALLVGRTYRHEAATGQTGNGQGGSFLSLGEFPEKRPGTCLFPQGVFFPGRDISTQPVAWEQVCVTEKPAWDPSDSNRYRLRFGTEEPAYHWANDKFQWISVPRYDGLACEVGPLSRIMGAYAAVENGVRTLVNDSLQWAGLELPALNSTVGRMLSRGLESVVVADAALKWLDELDACLQSGNPKRQAGWSTPESGEGLGFTEVGRGALVHRVRLEKRRIVGHDYLIPSLWNFSPRSSDGTPSPLEQALASTPVADREKPLEVMRAVRAFDPCNACDVRIEDGDSGRIISVKVA